MQGGQIWGDGIVGIVDGRHQLTRSRWHGLVAGGCVGHWNTTVGTVAHIK